MPARNLRDTTAPRHNSHDAQKRQAWQRQVRERWVYVSVANNLHLLKLLFSSPTLHMADDTIKIQTLLKNILSLYTYYSII